MVFVTAMLVLEVCGQASRPRLQYEVGGGHGLGFGTMHAVSPGVAKPIGPVIRFQNYSAGQDSFEVHCVVIDFNLRIGDFFRVGVRTSNLLPGYFENQGELMARASFEVPRGFSFRYDGPQVSVVPVLWLGTGYAGANSAEQSHWVWRPAWAADATATVEVRWKWAYLQFEIGYRTSFSWTQDASSKSELGATRYTAPAFNDGFRFGVTTGARFRAF